MNPTAVTITSTLPWANSVFLIFLLIVLEFHTYIVCVDHIYLSFLQLLQDNVNHILFQLHVPLFLIYRVYLVFIYFHDSRTILEHGQPTRYHIHKENWLSFPQQPLAPIVFVARHWVFKSFSPPWWNFDILYFMEATITAVNSWGKSPVIFRRRCYSAVFSNFWLFQSFCPIFSYVSWVFGGDVYKT